MNNPMKDIVKVKRSDNENHRFTILLPSWNLLEYLKLCIESLRKNSHYQHQIIIFINEGSDGTLEWVRSQEDLDYVYAPQNIGICYALNSCRSLIKTDYVVYVNDDMYFLPDWDKILIEEVERIGHPFFMLSSTMIEPAGNNLCGVVKDFGRSPSDFREEDLLNSYQTLFRKDWSGSSWPPNIMHIDAWDLVGGMSIEFSPGMASDQDLARKFWEIGCRIFIGKGNSLVYHFGCRSTGRIKKNAGNKTFTLKWRESARTFMKRQLFRGQDAVPEIEPVEFSLYVRIMQFFKRIKYSF